MGTAIPTLAKPLGRSAVERNGALIARLWEFLPGLGFLESSVSSVKTEEVFLLLLCVLLPQKAGCVWRPAFAQPLGGPGGACASGGQALSGLQGRRPPTASQVPPVLSFPSSPFPSPSSCTHSVRRLGQPAKESGVLVPGGPGLAVGGKALGTGKERKKKKHFSHRSWSGNQKECGMAHLAPKWGYDPLEGRTLQTNAICLSFKTQLREPPPRPHVRARHVEGAG